MQQHLMFTEEAHVPQTHSWRLDDKTKAAGREGIRAARRTLEAQRRTAA